jgi:hypothetical protein
MEEKMKKRILALVAVLALVGALVPATIFADATGTVTCTVSAALVSLTVSPGTVAYGPLALNTTQNTAQYNAINNPSGMATPQTQTITNTGNVAVNCWVKTSNAIGGTNWTLGNTAGADIFTHAWHMVEALYTGAGNITFYKWAAVDTYVGAGSTIGPMLDNHLELQIGMPTSVTDAGTHTITITVMAGAA